MSKHPLNLGVRFLLELFALAALGEWGWQLTAGWTRWLLAAAVPLFAAALWGVFAVPEDPSRSGKAPVPVPGWIRLLLEWGIFASTIWALHSMGRVAVSWISAGVVILHYGLSYDRVRWLLADLPTRRSADR